MTQELKKRFEKMCKENREVLGDLANAGINGAPIDQSVIDEAKVQKEIWCAVVMVTCPMPIT